MSTDPQRKHAQCENGKIIGKGFKISSSYFEAPHRRRFRVFQNLSIRKIGIKDVKEFLDNKFPDNPLSATAVHYLMKMMLGYSYKKAHKIPRKMMSKDRIRDFIEAAYLQVY